MKISYIKRKTLEEFVTFDKKFGLTFLSYLTVLIIFVNLNVVHSPVIGTIASSAYFLINGAFLGRAFLRRESSFLKLAFGILLLLVLLGLVGWLIMIIYNLDILRSLLTLLVVATLSSFLNRLGTRKMQREPKLQTRNEAATPLRFHCVAILYLFFVGLSFLLLFISRTGEVHTVWEVIHPLFLPTFFVSTFILLLIIFSSRKVGYKLLFVTLHSVLTTLLFVIIFPAGNIGVQQRMLGKTRLVFDGIIFHGFGWYLESIPLKAYMLLEGANFQTVFSVILARMFGVDVYWSHLLLVPLLWGTFIPLIAFMIARALGLSERISVLSSIVVSLFPANIRWGAESIPNGLSYLFFFCFLYFLLRHFKSNKIKDLFLVVLLFLASFMSHFLAGTIAFAVFLLARVVRTYDEGKYESPKTAKLAILIPFFVCVILLPSALVYRGFFGRPDNTHFSFNRLEGLTPTEIALHILLGSYFDFISGGATLTALIFGVGPLLGLIGMIYVLRARFKEIFDKAIRSCLLLLFLGFLLVVVDDRIVKFFMSNVPFYEPDRLWLFRDFIATPFVALLIGEVAAFLQRISLKPSLFRFSRSNKNTNLRSALAYLVIFILLSGWATASVYYAYPHFGPLQTTTYEIEAVKYIEEVTEEKYVVVCDLWIIFAGQMFVGISNSRAFYFSSGDPLGVSLFLKMKSNPSNETLIEAMKINNATIAYFIIEKPRLGAETYTQVVQQAEQNGLPTYPGGIFYYEGEEKLRIFYYKKSASG